MTSIYATRGGGTDSSDRRFGTDDEPALDTEAALDALNDPDCRALLAATHDDTHTAGELVQACDIPRSTLYRKLDRLGDAGLIEEGIRLSGDGTHASEYRRAVDAVTVSLSTGDGVEVGALAPAPPCD